jgi:polyisoprenoid-binding protein YceI
MIRKGCIALLAWLVAMTLAAAAKAQVVLLPAQSELTFTFKQMGVPVEGRFRRFDARVLLDPARPEGGSISFTIDTASATLGVAEIDAELPKPEWLAVARFPQASFVSSRVRAIDASRFEVVGKLSLKGAVREVTVPVTLAAAAGVSTASGTVTLKRSEFRIGEGSWSDPSLVADEVQVRFRLALRALEPAAGRRQP